MSSQYLTTGSKRQEAQRKSQELVQELEKFLSPLLIRLDGYVDKRLVETFQQTLIAIIQLRNRAQGLTISELGAYMTDASQAVAGSKRIDRLLSSQKWSDQLIEEFLWMEAEKSLLALQQEGQQVFYIHDGSVIEKPESEKSEGICAVKSAKAARLKKSRKGAFNRLGGKPIVVMGIEWIGGILVGMRGKPTLVDMKFWSRKGANASNQKREEEQLLKKMAVKWGKAVIHIFDRGYGSGPWISMMGKYALLFVIRWKKGNHFFDENREKKSLGDITKNKRSKEFREIWDEKKGKNVKTGIMMMPVEHEAYVGKLYVVVVRRGGEPWYLITNQIVETMEQAWECYKQYCRRWQVETVFRQGKSELAIETVRILKEEKRAKLLHMVSLVHAFLLYLCDEKYKPLREWLFKQYCHRTGKKHEKAKVPFYRVRWALSRLWMDVHPVFPFTRLTIAQVRIHLGENICFKNSG